MTIFRRILFFCILPLIIIFTIFIVLTSGIVYNKTIAFADEKTRIFANETAKQVDDDFISAQGLIKVVERHLAEIIPDVPQSQETAMYWVELILNATPYIHCIWFSFEPDVFISGKRFSRDFVKAGDSIAIVHDLDDDILDDPEKAPWYYYPFTTGNMWFESADFYDYGLGFGGKYTGTVSMPVSRGGKIVGVAGVDILYDDNFRFIAERCIKNERMLLLITSEGEIVYSADSSLAAKSIFDMDFKKKELIRQYLDDDAAFNITDISPFFGVKSRMYFYPVSNTESKSVQLYLYADLPESALFSEAKKAVLLIIVMSVLGIFIFTVILFFTVKKILKPIKALTENVNMVVNGKLDIDLDSVIDELFRSVERERKNEAYILFAALKNVKESLSNTQKIKAISKAKSDFLAKMSHEIRTPMNAITGMTELALRENMPPAARGHVLTIKQAGANLLSIINDILDLSKIESGKFEIAAAPYSFSTLINDVISIIRMKALDSGVRFVVNIDSRIPNALAGDEIRIRQILLNILGNAVKYTQKGYISFVVFGEITKDDTVLLTIDVTDTGKGIKQEDIDKLFDDFVQVDLDGSRNIEGTGLGLAITKNLVKAMGGGISVMSEYKKGATFTVKLPQKILMPQPLAVVEKSEEKRAIVYERREILANSIVCTIDNLGVECVYADSEAEFRGKLKEREYDFIFVESNIYSNVKKNISEVNSKAKIVLLTNFGDSVADTELSVIVMPAYSISVANIMNGVSDSSYNTSEDMLVRFNAPQARVLVVDDINTNLKVTQGLLSPYKMQIDLCLSGAKAVDKVKTNLYDLVFMDHMMPGMDGVEATRLIRESDGDYYKNLPIIALTANAIFGMREKFIADGFSDFISKPIDVVRLNAVLEKWIPKEKKTAAAAKRGAKRECAVDFTLAGVDVPLGLSRTGGSAEGYLRSIEIFSKDVQKKLGEIKSCLETDNIALYTTHVHGIKGAAAAIGAVTLSEAAKELEMAAKRQDRAFIEARNTVLLEDLETLVLGIERVISAKKQKLTPQSVDTQTLRAAMASLKAAIDEFDTAAINGAVKTLRQFENVSGDTGGVVESVLQNILGGGYDEAAALIESFMGRVNTP